jgi:hypothetical protein
MHASRADLPSRATSRGYATQANDELPTLWEGFAKLVGAGLDITAFGANIMDLPPDYTTSSHDEAETGQQELYVALRGSGAVVIRARDTRWTPTAWWPSTPAPTESSPPDRKACACCASAVCPAASTSAPTGPPLLRDVADEQRERAARSRCLRRTACSGSGHRLLLAEDDDAVDDVHT